MRRKLQFSLRQLLLITAIVGVILAAMAGVLRYNALPRDAVEFNDRAARNLVAQRIPDALHDVNRAIDLNPEYAQAYYIRAVIYASQGNDELAAKDFERCIAISPSNWDAVNGLGLMHLRNGNYETSIQMFSNIIETEPDRSTAYINRGIAYLKLHQYDFAINDFDIAIEYDPRSAITYQNRSIAYAALGKVKEADADKKRALILKGQQNP
jgi:tetratricopeptide (TPR) repeat protein